MGEELSKEEKRGFYKRFDTLDKSLIRILGVLEKDEKLGEKGLVTTVKEIEKTVQELLVREMIYKAKATTWGIVGGAIVTTSIWFIKFVIAKLIIV